MELSRNKNITVEKLIFWAFCGMFFSFPLGTTPVTIFGMLVLLLWIFSGKFFKERALYLKKRRIFLPVAVFIIISWIGLIYTKDLTTGLDFARRSYYWLFAFAIASLSFSNYSPKTFLRAFLVGLTITSLFSVLQFIGFIPIKEWLPTVFHRYIVMSLLLVLGISILSFYYFKENKLKLKILFLFLMGLFLFTLSIGGGRSGYVAFIALSPLIIYNIMGQKHFFKITIINILVVGTFFLIPTVQHRLSQGASDIRLYLEGNPNTSIGRRFHMWEGAVKIFLKNPIIGVGTGGYQLAMEEFSIPALEGIKFRHPHNCFLHIAANHGIVGLISLGLLFVIILKSGWKGRHTIMGWSIFSCGLIFLISSLTDTHILIPITGMLFGVFIGLPSIIPEDSLVSSKISPKFTPLEIHKGEVKTPFFLTGFTPLEIRYDCASAVAFGDLFLTGFTDKKTPLSVAIVTKNEEKNLPDALRSVSFVNDIVIVDSGSTDRTVEIAKEFGCRVFIEDWKGDAPQRNSALEKCKHEWVFVLDADERITIKLKEAIIKIIERPQADAYSVKIKNYLHGKWIRYADWWPNWQIRLVNKAKGSFVCMIHEKWVTKGEIHTLDAHIEHYSFSNYSEMLSKLNDYSTRSAKELFASGKKANCFSPIYHGVGMFLKIYFLKLGFLEGMDGLIIALTKAGGSFFKYAKLLELQQGQNK